MTVLAVAATLVPVALLGLPLAPVGLPLPASAKPARDARPSAALELSRHPVRANPNWRKLVLDQNAGYVYPKGVQVVSGGSGVVNPRGLEREGGGVTTISANPLSSPTLLLDLGIDAGGYVQMGVTASSGVTVHLGYSELKRYAAVSGDISPGDPSFGSDDAPGSRSDSVSAAGAWQSPGIRGAERWVTLQVTGSGSASIDYVRVHEEHFHPSVRDYRGHFLSSDRLLNRVWYAGAYTFALNSFRDLRPGFNRANEVVVDGAKRDRLVWIGDLVVENQLGQYAFSRAGPVVRDSLAVFSCQQKADGELPPASEIAVVCPAKPPPAGSPPPAAADQSPVTAGVTGGSLPDYTADWVVAVHDYDLFSGDDVFARRMLPVVERALGYFDSHLDANGLYSTPQGAINWHPFDQAAGEDTHTNAFVYRAVLDGADLERRLGKRAIAAGYARQAARLRAAIVTHLWDPSAHAFLLNASDPMRNHTQDAQVEAVLDGVVSGPRARQALGFISQHLEQRLGVANGQFGDDPYMSNYVSPYISGTELLARLSRGDTAGALALLRRTWGFMVNRDPGTLWEKVAFDGTPASYEPNGLGTGVYPNSALGAPGTTSLAHGWAGYSSAALSGYILGIRPLAPGYRRWLVAPQVGDLSWAQGQVPTRFGALVDRWRRGRRDGTFRMTVIAPRHTKGQVAVPLLGRNRTIALDGKIVWSHGRVLRHVHAHRSGDSVIFTQVGGSATYAWAAGASDGRRPG